MLVLSIALFAVAAALVLVVAAASAVHLDRKSLMAVADGAAVAAADAIHLGTYYTDEAATGQRRVPLTDETVRQAVADYLATAPVAQRLGEVRIGVPTGSPDGHTAEVTLVAVSHPPFTPWSPGGSGGIELSVTARAVSA